MAKNPPTSGSPPEPVDLVVVTSEEFEAFRLRTASRFANAQVASGGWGAELALDRALEAFDAIAPEGLATPGQRFFQGVAEGRVIGWCWLALERPPDGGAWIYDLEVEPALRGRGYGRGLLEAAATAAGASGAPHLGLNVFWDNEVARGLYASAGFRVVQAQMRRSLGPLEEPGQ